MTFYKVTILDEPEPYFVEAESTDQAIDEIKAMLNIEEVSGDIEEIVQ